MPPLNRNPPSKRFSLNERMRAIANASGDPLVRDVQKVLELFEYSEVVQAQYLWKYLPDDAFTKVYCGVDTNAFTVNHALLSHLGRVIEAFELVSVWRAWELLDACVNSLNNDHLIAAATLGRSLVELTVTYGDAANILRTKFESFPWQDVRTRVLRLDHIDERGKKVGLESFIERLMGGTRMNDLLEASPNMEQKNILTIVDRMDKALRRQNAGYAIRPHYDFLCELAHPNTIGYQRFLTSVSNSDDGWTTRLMEAASVSERSLAISDECLWVISFSAGSLDGFFGEFQKVMRGFGKHLGRLLPK